MSAGEEEEARGANVPPVDQQSRYPSGFFRPALNAPAPFARLRDSCGKGSPGRSARPRGPSLSVGPSGQDTPVEFNQTVRPGAVMEVTAMSTGKAILASIRQQLNLSDYRKTHWEGSFDEYLDIVREHPEVTRSAYQRLYDMIISHGTEEVFEHKEKIIRYRFFTEYAARLGDGIFGL